MKKHIYGSDRDNFLDEVEGKKELLEPSDDLQFSGYTLFDQNKTYVIYQAGKLNKDKRKEVLDTEKDIILLTKEKENLHEDLLEQFDSEKRGDTEGVEEFFDKLDPLIFPEFEFSDIETLQQIPMEYLLERFSKVHPNLIGQHYEAISTVNQRLYSSDREMMYHYLAINVNLPGEEVFYKDNREKESEKLIEELQEITDKSEQEVRRNIRVLVTQHFNELDYSIKSKIGEDRELHEVKT